MLCLIGCANAPANGPRTLAGNKGQLLKINLVFSFHKDNQIPQAELEDLLSSVGPDLVLVETTAENVLKEVFDSYRSEMELAYRWAKGNRKQVKGFDCDMETRSDDSNKEKFAKAVAEYIKFVSSKSWRDASIEAVGHEVAIIDAPMFNLKRMARRQNCMLRNIRSGLPTEGTVLIVTGVYHSDFFRRSIDGAVFPAAPN